MDKKPDILIDGETGEMRFCEWINERLHIFGVFVPPGHPARKAMEAGLRVLEMLNLTKERYDWTNMGLMKGDETCEFVVMLPVMAIKPIEPPEKIGLEWLMAQPVGSIWSNGAVPFVVGRDGLYWPMGSCPDSLWEWGDYARFKQAPWTERASPETCTPWTHSEEAESEDAT